jgi:hypothetical protein
VNEGDEDADDQRVLVVKFYDPALGFDETRVQCCFEVAGVEAEDAL